MKFQTGDQVLWNGEIKYVHRIAGGIVFFYPAGSDRVEGATPKLLSRHQIPWERRSTMDCDDTWKPATQHPVCTSI